MPVRAVLIKLFAVATVVVFIGIGAPAVQRMRSLAHKQAMDSDTAFTDEINAAWESFNGKAYISAVRHGTAAIDINPTNAQGYHVRGKARICLALDEGALYLSSPNYYRGISDLKQAVKLAPELNDQLKPFFDNSIQRGVD
jgi:hypothetical protein